MKALKDRLVEARTESGLSQAQLAKAVGAGQSTIASIENGRNKGSSLFLDLARALNVNVEWLVDGTGSKRDTVSSLQTDHRKIASAWPFPDISEEDVRALPKAHINALQGALALAIAQLKLGVKISTHVTMMRGGQPANGTAPDEFPMTATRHDNPWEGGTTTRYEESLLQLHISRTPKVGHVPKAGYSADDQDLLPVPELDVRLAAGELGIENYEETAIGEILFRRSFLESFKLPLSRMKIVYAQGDSMEPVIRNGGPMLFFEDPVTDPREIDPRTVYAINHGGKMIVKCIAREREGGWLAKSLNPAYAPFPLEKEDGCEVRIVGRILWSPYDLRNGVDERLL